MKTYSTKMSAVQHAWHVIDATDQPLGRLATRVATLLRGKHKPIYQPNLPVGDFVVVINAERVRVSGNKSEDKIYYRHSQYPGGLKTVQYRHQMEKFPTRAVEKAIKGMLPHNSLGRKLFTRLKVYAGPEHPHEAQVVGSAKLSAVSDQPLGDGEREAPARGTARAVAAATAAPVAAVASAEETTLNATADTEAADETGAETETESTAAEAKADAEEQTTS